MVTTSKKRSKKSKVTRTTSRVESVSQLKKTIATQARELRQAVEQQTATSEVLRVIASSPTDIQPVLDTVVESAARLCEATDAVIHRFDGNTLWLVAHYGPIPLGVALGEKVPSGRGVVHGRAITDRQTIHVHDIAAEIETEFPDSKDLQERTGTRTILATPMLREGVPIGAIVIRRTEVRPFSDKQIALLKTFADQAVIALENVRLFRELKESLEQQTATSEILGVIASSPRDIQPVLDTIAENAARVCGASDAVIRRIAADALLCVAHYGSLPGGLDPIPLSRGSLGGRAVADRQTIHVSDIAKVSEGDFPVSHNFAQRFGYRTVLATPLIHEGLPLGVIVVRRTEVLPFTDKQIKLLETFADQAVIAIENVRLFKEIQERNAELREALEHQTATAEVLGIISRSPTDVQPVLDAIVESAARVCGIDDVVLRLREGNTMVVRAHFGPIPLPIGRKEISIDEPRFRWMREHGTLHIPDLREQNDFQEISGARTFLIVPLRQQGELVGTLGARRIEVRPFTPAQIKLLETFADQAVIAIENVRLFNELKESLEQQTATSEILGVIASSPTDVQPVLNVVAENAARLCDANDALIERPEGNKLRIVAKYGAMPLVEFVPFSRGVPTGRAVLDRQTIHVHDILAEIETEYPDGRIPQQVTGTRTMLITPLLREGGAIGCIAVRRTEVRPFTDKQIKLLKTFADQAVIAIENVRLFQELEARTRELARSVGELKALGEVGQAVSSTLELETVLTRIASHAVQLSGADGGAIYEYDETVQELHLRGSHQIEKELVEALRTNPIQLGWGAVGQAAVTRAPVQVTDVLEEREYAATRTRPTLGRLGYRSLLAVPLLREDRIMGGLAIYRRSTGSFSTEIVNLLQTFATQSVLAIQNARLFREIEDKSRQIEAANRHKSEFLANMSHELRTPLNAIIGFSEVLGERMFGELNEKQAEYTEDILSSGRHLLSLINEILDLSKVEAGRMELEVAAFDLPLAIENARTFVRERAIKHGINLDVTIDERLGDFVGDERKIKQILLNLLSNAVKFTPEGGRIGIAAK
jgi:GAF domain-containing protein